MTFRQAWSWDLYENPRQGRVKINVYSKWSRDFEGVAGSSDDEIFQLASSNSYMFEVPLELEQISGVGIEWFPSNLTTANRIYPMAFKLESPTDFIELCRRDVSIGIAPGKEYVFRTYPSCKFDFGDVNEVHEEQGERVGHSELEATTEDDVLFD